MRLAVSWHNLTMHLRIGDQSVRVLALEQRDVYADVIEGVPNAHINAGIVADALARAGHRHGGSPCLVPPRVRPLRSSAEPKEVLPRVCCIARVRGAPPRDPAADHGEACLVWFQDDVEAQAQPHREVCVLQGEAPAARPGLSGPGLSERTGEQVGLTWPLRTHPGTSPTFVVVQVACAPVRPRYFSGEDPLVARA